MIGFTVRQDMRIFCYAHIDDPCELLTCINGLDNIKVFVKKKCKVVLTVSNPATARFFCSPWPISPPSDIPPGKAAGSISSTVVFYNR